MINRHRSDSHVCRRQSGALAAVVALQQTSQAGHWPNDWIVPQTVQQFRGLVFLMGPHAGVHFGDVDGAAGQQMTLLHDLFKEPISMPLAIDSVNDDSRIEQVSGHFSGRLSFENVSRPGGAICPPTWPTP